jgi:hypothetical protein
LKHPDASEMVNKSSLLFVETPANNR